VGPRMDSPRTDDAKARIRICPECEHHMTAVANAMRRHACQMFEAIELVKRGLSEDERQEAAVSVRQSFNEAQSAWDAYREHLIDHGLIAAE
jgi:hypothetical protein